MILTLIEFAVAGAGIFGLIFKVYWLLYAAAALCIAGSIYAVAKQGQNGFFTEIAAIIIGAILAWIFKWNFFVSVSAALCIEEIAMSFFGAVTMVLGLFIR